MDTFDYKEITLEEIDKMKEFCQNKDFICNADTKQIEIIDKGE